MLNRFGGLGGYGIQLTWPQDAILFFPRIVDTTGGDLGYYAIYWRYLIGASTLSAIFILLRREKRATLFFLAGSLLVLLPIVPVSAGMSHRVVLLPVFLWIIIHIFAWDRLLAKIHSRFSQIAVFIWAAVVLSGFIYASHNHIVLTKDSIFRKGVEGRFVLQEGSSFDMLFHPVQYGHYYNGLLWLRNTVLHLSAGPAVTYDPNIICSNELLEERHRADIKKYEKAWYFDSKSNKIISENIKNFCNRENLNVIRMDVPFSLDILYKNSVITWQFGPYERGSYAILLGSVASEIYPLPMQGRRFNSYKGQTLEFRLRYESPEGWVTYSPLLDIVIDDEDYCHVRWQR